MTLVLLHGFVGAPEDFRAVIDALPPGVETRVLALPGHDPSRPVPPELDFEAVADHILFEVTSKASLPIHLVGYSLGARLALSMCAREPSKIAKATLIGVNPGLVTDDECAERQESDEAWAVLLESQGMEAFLAKWYAQPTLRTRRPRPSRSHHDPDELARALRQLGLGHMPSYWAELSGMQMPVDLIVGEEDEKFCTLAQRMQSRMPHANLIRVPGAGHNVVLDQPEVLARELARSALAGRLVDGT